MEDVITRLQEIQAELQDLVEEARDLVRGTPEEDRAEGYWLAQLRMAISHDHHYLGSGGVCMADTIEALGQGTCCEECGAEIPAEDVAAYREVAGDDQGVPEVCGACADRCAAEAR